MPGWISCVPIPEPQDSRIVRAIVLEIGDHPQRDLIPFSEGDTVFFPSNCGMIINDAVFLISVNVRAWNHDG
jgi:hypothetical protein